MPRGVVAVRHSVGKLGVRWLCASLTRQIIALCRTAMI
jgi:hypothetical protein